MSEHAFTNNLIHETSPYLLQHAHNPVKWYPWGEDAFQRARMEDKPIFLSIGYSTCHWCHVMERESFEDERVGRMLNDHYIAIKVDREERPDVDAIYMRVCQVLTGSGGWPLTIIMTPDKKPFFAGTYFPKESKGQYFGLIDILKRIATMWKDDRKSLIQNSDEIHDHLVNNLHPAASPMDAEALNHAFDSLTRSFDRIYGGFGMHPKFPTPHTLLFLLRTYKHTKHSRALRMVEHTLKSLYKGGIFDHVGYGFSRYSTDHRWLVPHFEKMLYDNALLAIAYLETYTITGDSLHHMVTEKIFTYILRDMTDGEGAFYSAEDADSEGVEGKFYVWSYDELTKLLDGNEVKLLTDYYGVTRKGNFEGKNILNLIDTDIDIVERNHTHDKTDTLLEKLYEIRLNRIPPFKDTKILTSWNGLMIAALSMGGRILQDDRYIEASKKAVSFIKTNMMKDGRLLSSYKDGRCSAEGYLDDYAFFVWGLLELFRATNDAQYLKDALAINHKMLEQFWDDKNGGLFLYGKDHEQLLIRPKEHYDGATPSGNSVALQNLTKLYHYTHDEALKEKADRILEVFGASINRDPTSHTNFLSGHLTLETPHRQVVLAGKTGDSKLNETLQAIDQRFLPFTTVMVNDGNEELTNLMPELENYPIQSDEVNAYVCENFSCKPPIQDMDALLDQLN